MRGAETTPNEDPTTQALDPKHVEETSEPGTAATARTTRRAENEEPMERRYGMSMEEIYASAKGLGVKDQLRMLIDLTWPARRTSRTGGTCSTCRAWT